MNPIYVVVAAFSVLGALDRIVGNRFGIGKEFEKGLRMFGELALSMIGMILLAPWIAGWLSPCFNGMYDVLGLDPSVLPAMLFANDMGGAALAGEIARDASLGSFNAYVVASMMGCTVSFTLPCAMELVAKEQRPSAMLGFLCGVVCIPVGCFVSGLCMGIPVPALLWDLLPLLVLAAVIAAGLWFARRVFVGIFTVFGYAVRVLITVGLVLGILQYLLGLSPLPEMAKIEEGALVCFNIAVVMTGVFPLLSIVRRILRRPLEKLAAAAGLRTASVLGFVATLATTVSTFEMMKEMDERGVACNAAFLVPAGFLLADHLAFTMASNAGMLPFVLVGKLTAGVLALALAVLVTRRRTPGAEKTPASAANANER